MAGVWCVDQNVETGLFTPQVLSIRFNLPISLALVVMRYRAKANVT